MPSGIRSALALPSCTWVARSRAAAPPAFSPRPCGGGAGVGVAPVGTVGANTPDPPPRPSPSRNRVYACFGHLMRAIEIGNSRFRLGEGEETATPHATALPARAGEPEEGSPVVLRAAPASAAPFNCCTPLLLGISGRAGAAIGTLSREKCYCDCHKTVSRFCSAGGLVRRVVEPTGPAFGGPDDRLREAHPWPRRWRALMDFAIAQPILWPFCRLGSS
jgi:hypothetical protein